MMKSEFLNNENICLINENNTSVTYGEIYQFSLKLEFINTNELSILLVENDLISYKLYLGLLIAKKPFLILDKNLSVDFIKKFISDYQPTHIFSSSTFISSSLLDDFHYRVITKYGINRKLIRMGIEDSFEHCGDYEYNLEKHRSSSEKLCERFWSILNSGNDEI